MTTWQNTPGTSYQDGGGPNYGTQQPSAPSSQAVAEYSSSFVQQQKQSTSSLPYVVLTTNNKSKLYEGIDNFNFDNVSIRRAFVRKVYLILMLQLLVTFLFAAYFTYNEEAKLFAWRNVTLFYGCLITTFILMIVMACCENARRTAPLNFILLGIFTVAESILIGFIASFNEEKHLLMAVGMTCVICFALTLFAFQTKYDFTGMGTYLFVGAVVLMLFGFVLILFQSSVNGSGFSIAALVYSSIGALLFSFYLVYDTQIMLGGKHRYSLSPEEYIFAALNLYLDVVNVFLSILNILSFSSD